MNRRHVLLAAVAAGLNPGTSRAHHGWSSFDASRPLYLAGTARRVAWRNPHVEFDLEVAADLTLPAELRQRTLPAQSAAVDGPALLAAAQLPARRDKVWHIELAPLTRMDAWKVTPLRDGDAVSMLGYTFSGERGDAVFRVEYLFVGPASYGLRSSPA